MTVPIAQQFLLANSPVADLFKAQPAATPGRRGAASAGRQHDGFEHGGCPIGDSRPDEVRPDDSSRCAAGQRVEIAFVNADDMPHNVVIFKRGDIAIYEKELFGSMNEPNAQLRGFVPDSPNVLVATRLLNARESDVLVFDAPPEPGDYPFVCSFPGHWFTMRGVLRVE